MKVIEIYTDGACSNNPGPGGWGAILRCGQDETEISGGEVATTNNRMEMVAFVEALKTLTEPSCITLYSDSQYLINGLEKGWAKNWKSRGWKKKDGKPALNPDLWDELLELTKQHTVQYVWVKGHAGHFENERCDRLAVQQSLRFAGQAATEKEGDDMKCYKSGGCGVYEMRSCSECPASKPSYAEQTVAKPTSAPKQEKVSDWEYLKRNYETVQKMNCVPSDICLVAENHVFDEDQSVKWNREKVVKNNEKYQAEVARLNVSKNEAQNELFKKICFRIQCEARGITHETAMGIWNYANSLAQNSSFLGNKFDEAVNHVDELVKLARMILEEKK